MSTPGKKDALGKGIRSLLQSIDEDLKTTAGQLKPTVTEAVTGILRIPVADIEINPKQPRRDFDEQALKELSDSIKMHDIIQPVTVSKLPTGKYRLISGERRWRASQLAGLAEVPCMLKDVPDEAAVAIALIENIQREDLNAMEEAVALDRLLTEFALTHQQVADAVGKSRASVTNLLRLNQLNDDVKLLLEHGDIEMGHARALLALKDNEQSDAARLVAAKQLTVRETENLVRRILEPKPAVADKPRDPDVLALEQRLSERFAAPVQISYNNKGKQYNYTRCRARRIQFFPTSCCKLTYICYRIPFYPC